MAGLRATITGRRLAGYRLSGAPQRGSLKTAPTSLALSCRWRSRPQHQKLTFRVDYVSNKIPNGRAVNLPLRPQIRGHGWRLAYQSNGYAAIWRYRRICREKRISVGLAGYFVDVGGGVTLFL